MSRQEIAFRREVGGAQSIQPSLALGQEGQADDQRRRVEAWLHLTRVTLPAAAAKHHWPISLDHCFMRVLLDNAVGGVWHHTIPRPAIRHIDPATLGRAIALGHQVLQTPVLLPDLNRRSLAWRGARAI